MHQIIAKQNLPKITNQKKEKEKKCSIEKDIVLHQVLHLLSDLLLKNYHPLTLAHVFLRWFVCEERKGEIRRLSVLQSVYYE